MPSPYCRSDNRTFPERFYTLGRPGDPSFPQALLRVLSKRLKGLKEAIDGIHLVDDKIDPGVAAEIKMLGTLLPRVIAHAEMEGERTR